MDNIVTYVNGNYQVFLDTSNGTMVRYSADDELRPHFPDSMDIKITDCCDGINGMVCPWCHEQSTPQGKHADLLSASFIDNLHPYTQLALGGGNVLLHPDLESFLQKCKELSLIPSITVHQEHFMENLDFLKYLRDEHLIYGLGISLTRPTDDFLDAVAQFPNAVIHVIAGIVSGHYLQAMRFRNLKILILGYKTFGRGAFYKENHSAAINYYIDILNECLPSMVEYQWFESISFDNLALEQLDVKSLMSEKDWNQFYMGADGTSTMYVDMVKREFAKSSTSVNRHPLLDNIEDMLAEIHKENSWAS